LKSNLSAQAGAPDFSHTFLYKAFQTNKNRYTFGYVDRTCF
jgi:hypothetical protein